MGRFRKINEFLKYKFFFLKKKVGSFRKLLTLQNRKC